MIIKEQNYRVKRGTKAADLPSQRAASPPPLDSLDGPFRLAEYLSYKVWRDPHDVQGLVELPKGDEGEAKQDKNVWIYEHLRRLPIDLTPLLTSLLPVCSKESCPQMKADEWMYLCVAHGGAGTEECCAIDYILHTVDSTATLLNSSKSFPSRMSIPNTSLSHFPSLFRRLSRIFSHAYYHHREAFSLAEAETSLYARFVALCETYDLVGANLLVIPKSAISTGESSHSAEEEDEPSSEESEDADDDDGEGEENRGREGEEKGKERRTQSLDRNPSPGDDRGGRRKEGLLPRTPATAPDEGGEALQTAKHESNLDRSKTVKTLGRGKQTRGTMLWSSDTPPVPPPPPSVPPTDESGAAPSLERSESLDTVVHISPEPTKALLPPIEGVTEASSSADTSEEPAKPSAAPTEEIPAVETQDATIHTDETADPSDASKSESVSTDEQAPAETATEGATEESGGGEMVDIKLDESEPQHAPPAGEPTAAETPSSPNPSTSSDTADGSSEVTSSPSAPSTHTLASSPELAAPKSPNPDNSPVRSRSAHGVGRTAKPSTPAKSFVASTKSPAAPVLSTGGSGDSPAKSGESAPEKTEKVEEKSPLSTNSVTVPSADAE